MNNKYSEEQLNVFIGKLISFSDKKGESFIGTCESIGYNTMLPEWELQITLDDRTPISNINFESIKLLL